MVFSERLIKRNRERMWFFCEICGKKFDCFLFFKRYMRIYIGILICNKFYGVYGFIFFLIRKYWKVVDMCLNYIFFFKEKNFMYVMCVERCF